MAGSRALVLNPMRPVFLASSSQNGTQAPIGFARSLTLIRRGGINEKLGLYPGDHSRW
jgi:hypothetical protein